MKLKFLILSLPVLAAVSCASMQKMSSDGQRYADGIYFNGRTNPSEPKDYVPTYKAKVDQKFDNDTYLALVGGTASGIVILGRVNAWYDPWYWNSWYGPWYNPWYWDPWYWDPWYGPGWYGPGWYRPGWYRPGWYRPGWYGPGWYGPWWGGTVRSGHSPVGGYSGVNPTHSGGMGSYSSGRGRSGGMGGYYRQGNAPSSVYRSGGSSSVNRGGGSMGGSATYNSGGGSYGGGVNRGGGSYGGGSFGGGSRGSGGSHGGMGGGGRR